MVGEMGEMEQELNANTHQQRQGGYFPRRAPGACHALHFLTPQMFHTQAPSCSGSCVRDTDKTGAAKDVRR